ncbi:Protein of unknown function [Variovorax sp. HW608]|uniref:DUF2970 domain-containing protein n=1 Tax=Variovorax sp. HW608 TaxID=1034889 RepID=UPI00081FB253|nr:DUF2970 domain-containing protein [Variovorax sp. HW608]SCK13669.1 Protein of unknown function [Variovorax sp. HW608]
MSRFRRSLQAVLWAAIGLGGRRADADQRVDGDSLWIILVLALVLVLGLIGGLLALARLAAG